MRDTGVLIALVLGTIAAGILFFYAWPVKNEVKTMRAMLYAIAAMLSFCWVSVGWMWFSV